MEWNIGILEYWDNGIMERKMEWGKFGNRKDWEIGVMGATD